MEFKGTKGKWISKGKDVVIETERSGDSLICECISKRFNKYPNTEEQAEANAKLIACAPEMLEILQMFEANLRHGYVIDKNRLNQIQSLIKKAVEL